MTDLTGDPAIPDPAERAALNAALLTVRIRCENRLLAEAAATTRDERAVSER